MKKHHSMPSKQVAKNYRQEFLYYMPENDDRVDPGFNFEEDLHVPNRDPLTHDVYAHELYGKPQYDGILISKVNIDSNKKKNKLIRQIGIRNFLRLPKDTPIMGDCGAFSYAHYDHPPYTTDEMLEHYQFFEFDYGFSVDHSIAGKYENNKIERNRRYDLTLHNAREFLEKHRLGCYTFTPIGVVQGFDATSYGEGVAALIEMGYTYVALGGLARATTSKILNVLKQIAPLVPDDKFRLHLFGVTRSIEEMHLFHQLGVTSFDSASALRKAFSDAKDNYHTLNGNYISLRVPDPEHTSKKVKQHLQAQKITLTEIKMLEQQAIQALRDYQNGVRSVDETLQAIVLYDSLLGENRKKNIPLYIKTLEDKPWETYECPICQSTGIDIIIFRGNNRNRRRGFHNTHIFYQQLLRLRKQILPPNP